MAANTEPVGRFLVVVSRHWRRGFIYDVVDTITGDRHEAQNREDAEDAAETMNRIDAAVQANTRRGCRRLLADVFAAD